jgi:sulfatase maturation enzyme AslB (radical SAM superfamily)
MRECFGNIYPDLTRVEYNKQMSGKVFSVRINSHGPVPERPRLTADMTAWNECQKCEVYQSCFDFSNARLGMQHALSRF